MLYFVIYTDYFVRFTESLCVEGEKIWKLTMGRYFLAIGHLVMGLLKETEHPVDKLLFALKELKGKQSAKKVAQTVQKGLLN